VNDKTINRSERPQRTVLPHGSVPFSCLIPIFLRFSARCEVTVAE
jgi:hypothetical protein